MILLTLTVLFLLLHVTGAIHWSMVWVFLPSLLSLALDIGGAVAMAIYWLERRRRIREALLP